jgi:hypothetical protein
VLGGQYPHPMTTGCTHGPTVGGEPSRFRATRLVLDAERLRRRIAQAHEKGGSRRSGARHGALSFEVDQADRARSGSAVGGRFVRLVRPRGARRRSRRGPGGRPRRRRLRGRRRAGPRCSVRRRRSSRSPLWHGPFPTKRADPNEPAPPCRSSLIQVSLIEIR